MNLMRYTICHDENNAPTLVGLPDGNVVFYDEAMAEIERLNDELLCCSEAYEAIKAENDRFKETAIDPKPVAVPNLPTLKPATRITYDNRSRVIGSIQRILSAAERFSAFSGAGGFDARDGQEGPRELKTWADMAASDFDEEYGNLASLLGPLPQRRRGE